VYAAGDGSATAEATVALTVKPLVEAPPPEIENQRPLAVNDSFTIESGATLDVSAAGVMANDSDPEGLPTTATLFSGPMHGTVSLAEDGSFSYTPATDFVGMDAFMYRVHDGELWSPLAAVSIHVTPAAEEPSEVPPPCDEPEEVPPPCAEQPEEVPPPAEQPEEVPPPCAEQPEEVPPPAEEPEEVPPPCAEVPQEVPPPCAEQPEEIPPPAEEPEEVPPPCAEAPEEVPAPAPEQPEEVPPPCAEQPEEVPPPCAEPEPIPEPEPEPELPEVCEVPDEILESVARGRHGHRGGPGKSLAMSRAASDAVFAGSKWRK
jgi:hypothetical protein